MRRNVWSLPDVFKVAILCFINNFDPPRHRIRGDGKVSTAYTPHRHTKLFRFPRFHLCLGLSTRWEIASIHISTLTIFMVYPAPEGLMSHFESLDPRTPNYTKGRTSPLPSGRFWVGRQHTALEFRSISRNVSVMTFWIL